MMPGKSFNIRVSVVRFRPWPPSSSNPSSATPVGRTMLRRFASYSFEPINCRFAQSEKVPEMVKLRRPMTRRIANRVPPIVIVVLLIALHTTLGGCGREAGAPTEPAARTVNFYNWSDYIAPEVVEGFEKETGIRVVSDTIDTYEILETKLLTGRSGYDVVVIGGPSLRVISTGAFMPLDRSKLPNWHHLDPDLMTMLANHDPGNRHAAGYLWGTTGIAFNVARVRKLSPDAPTDSWSLVFDPGVISRLAPCGFSIIDSRSEVIASALAYLGRDPNSTAPDDLKAVEPVLAGIRPSIRKIDSESQINDLATGDICVMITWGTTVSVARARAAEMGSEIELRYVLPQEGTISSFDTFAIPVDAPHPTEAHAFIDYLLRPEIAAANTNFIGNRSMNRAATPFLLESIRNDATVYPPPEVMQRLTPLMPDDQEQSRAESRVWTRFRTGQ